MDPSWLLHRAKTAPVEELEDLRLDLVAACAIVDVRLAQITPPRVTAAQATTDMTADEVAADLGLRKRSQVYSLASRPYDPLPSYNVNSRVKRFPRLGVAEWKKRQVERGRA